MNLLSGHQQILFLEKKVKANLPVEDKVSDQIALTGQRKVKIKKNQKKIRNLKCVE